MSHLTDLTGNPICETPLPLQLKNALTAPTGRIYKAQGDALGSRIKKQPSPEVILLKVKGNFWVSYAKNKFPRPTFRDFRAGLIQPVKGVSTSWDEDLPDRLRPGQSAALCIPTQSMGTRTGDFQ